MKKYNPEEIEKKWQKYWDKNKTFAASDDVTRQKFYALIEFPYPSGAGLHVGHPRPFTAMDVVSRKKRMEGCNVLYPIGFDAFGLPTENYAIKTGRPPAEVTKENIATFTRQLKSLGFGFDWSRVIDTTDPKYYKWTQWLFLQFFKAGLAYKKNQPINWCPKDKIGLANEEVVGGCCERCGTPVEARNKEQWMLAITKYAEQLLQGLEEVKYIPEAKAQQQNWIGKSEGALIKFVIARSETTKQFPGFEEIEVFTTRPDTLFGVTYIAIAPEVAKKWLEVGWETTVEVKKYIAECIAARAVMNTREEPEKTGIETGVTAVNPATGETVPVWITNYVLSTVGTGAVMGVPAHDERDFEFAKKYNLSVRQVIAPQFIEPVNPPRPDKKTVRRRTVHAIVSRKSDGAILMLSWKGAVWGSRLPHTFIIGGVEDGEDVVEAAKREIMEETGYRNIRFVRSLGVEFHTQYHAAHKDENRYAEIHPLHFELDDEAKDTIALAESAKHDPVWIPQDEVGGFVNVVDGPFEWRWFTAGGFALTEDGVLIHSAEFSGLTSAEAKQKITEKFGVAKTNYKLRDWVFSRQRYWGEPIPIVICDKCGYVPVPEDQLPLTLPQVEKYEPTDTGESPLSKIDDWVKTDCPRCTKLSADTPKYLIFDFDGVVGDTFEASLRARVTSGYAKDRDDALAQMEEYFDKKPYHAKGHTMTDEMVAWNQRFTAEYGAQMNAEGFDLFAEFIAEIKKIKNTKIAIVSSGSKLYIENKIAVSGLDATHVLTFEDHHSKEEKIASICKAWEISEQDAFYFTDTKADVYELEEFLDRRNIIGCAWGYHGFEKLKEVLPENQILKNYTDIHNVFVPGTARRETDTMPNWAGSSWYWLRYMDPHNDTAFAAPEKLQYWAPVDWYNGGNEHTVLHLLYSRFWNQFLYDQGLVPTLEPYKKRTSHGIILAEDGEKMSKSRGNVVNPDDIVAQFGADALRSYIMFMGPFDQAVAWNTNGVVGVYRFLEKVWNLQEKVTADESGISEEQYKLAHRLVAKVSSDIDEMKFNTSVAKMMEFINEMSGFTHIGKSVYEMLIKVLAPFAPHVAEELWSSALGNDGSVALAPWPIADAKWLVDDSFALVIQVNGKVRDQLTVAKNLDDETVKKLALASEKIVAWLKGQEPKKVIYVKGKLVSIVV